MRHGRPRPAHRHRAATSEEGSLTAGARFVGSYPRADAPLAPTLPEVAVVGRSNVGKSSLINALVGARVARVSVQPGKTRLLNVYEVRLGRREQGEELSDTPRESTSDPLVPLPSPLSLYLLDLPGYGYARAGKAQRADLSRLVAAALERPRLAGVVWLLDIRHDPSHDDQAMQDVLALAELPVLAALTKGDKLPWGQRLERRAALQRALGLPADQIVVTSARTGDGIAELRAAVAALAGGGSGEEPHAACA